MTIQKVIKKLKENELDYDFDLINQAYEFAVEAHRGQKRATGDDFIIHPVKTAYTLAELKLNDTTIAAALLHDVPEDTPFSLKDVETKFGSEIAQLVDGVTKLGKFKMRGNPQEYYVENLRKMFLAMAADIRVVLIRLADRLHNMTTLQDLPPRKQLRIAKETLEIYAPIANRLGIGKIRGQLEDLSFSFLEPQKFQELNSQFAKKYKIHTKYIEKVKRILKKKLKQSGIKIVKIEGRAKYLYSLHRKLEKYDGDIQKIYDLVALRVIVPTIPDCYATLGIIHQDWPPLIGRIKDYIAQPKPNGYQSLHTTVFCREGQITEIQVRTPKMHEEAEHGIAAHWAYTEQKGLKSYLERKLKKPSAKEVLWVKQLSAWQKIIGRPEEFLNSLKIDFLKDRLFVFTPRGDVKDLPDEATAIDFAYAVHTDLGHYCSKVKINGKFAPLDYKLQNGDMVEIIMDEKKRGPQHKWLDFAKTNLAQNKIKNYFHKVNQGENYKIGKILLEEKLKQLKNISFDQLEKFRQEKILKIFPFETLTQFFEAIGQGDLSPMMVIGRIFTPQEILPPLKKVHLRRIIKSNQNKLPESIKNHLVNIAKCCEPLPGDPISGILTHKEKIVTIHKKECFKITDSNQIIDTKWDKEEVEFYLVPIQIKSWDRLGLIKDITTAITKLNINIGNVKTNFRPEGWETLSFELEIKKLDQLINAVSAIEKIPGVIELKCIS